MNSFVYLLILASLAVGTATPLNAQITHMDSLLLPESFENVHVTPCYSDSNTSSYVIWVKQQVAPHRHNHHSEHVYVMEGAGKMLLNNEVFSIQAGDFIFIPQASVHAVITTSDVPLKVISIQSPQFFNKDREWVELDGWKSKLGAY